MTSAQLAKLALEHVSRVLEKLTDDQLLELAAGHAHLEFRSMEVTITSAPASRAKRVVKLPAFDVQAVADEIRSLGSSDAITEYLNSHRPKFLKDDLIAIATTLGPTVSAKGTVPGLKRNIADGVAGFRERAAAIGTWPTD